MSGGLHFTGDTRVSCSAKIVLMSSVLVPISTEMCTSFVRISPAG